MKKQHGSVSSKRVQGRGVQPLFDETEARRFVEGLRENDHLQFSFLIPFLIIFEDLLTDESLETIAWRTHIEHLTSVASTAEGGTGEVIGIVRRGLRQGKQGRQRRGEDGNVHARRCLRL